MLESIGYAVVALVIGGILWFVRKSGKDAAAAAASRAAVKDITDANRPATADELGIVRDKYKRD